MRAVACEIQEVRVEDLVPSDSNRIQSPFLFLPGTPIQQLIGCQAVARYTPQPPPSRHVILTQPGASSWRDPPGDRTGASAHQKEAAHPACKSTAYFAPEAHWLGRHGPGRKELTHSPQSGLSAPQPSLNGEQKQQSPETGDQKQQRLVQRAPNHKASSLGDWQQGLPASRRSCQARNKAGGRGPGHIIKPLSWDLFVPGSVVSSSFFFFFLFKGTPTAHMQAGLKGKGTHFGGQGF